MLWKYAKTLYLVNKRFLDWCSHAPPPPQLPGSCPKIPRGYPLECLKKQLAPTIIYFLHLRDYPKLTSTYFIFLFFDPTPLDPLVYIKTDFYWGLPFPFPQIQHRCWSLRIGNFLLIYCLAIDFFGYSLPLRVNIYGPLGSALSR